MNAAEKQAEKFNAHYTVGQAISLELDDHTMMDSYLESEAWVIGGHSAIAKVAGKSGGWSIHRIHPRMGDS